MFARNLRVAAVAGALLVAGTSCGGHEDRLLVVGSPGPEGRPSSVWAVDAGDGLDGEHLVADGVTSPLRVLRAAPGGTLLLNRLGRSWQDGVVLAAGGDTTQFVVASRPGEEPDGIADGSGIEALVASRGTYVFEQDHCVLARTPTDVETLGTGRCSLSQDERWIASWPRQGGPLEVRDLRRGSVRTVGGTFTQAVSLAHDARILAVAARDDGSSVTKLIDATSGDVISTGRPADMVQALPAAHDGEGFLVVVRRGETGSLEWIDTDGTTTAVARDDDSDGLLLPANVGDGVDYLDTGTSAQEVALRHWSRDGTTSTLIEGELTATALTRDLTLVTRRVEEGLEFWSVRDGRLRPGPHFVLHTDATGHLGLQRVLFSDHTVHVEVLGGDLTSYVRVDLTGDGSAAPLRDWASAEIASIDHDGTAVLVGSEQAGDPQQRLVVVHPHDDEAVGRARAAAFAMSLVHEGTIYYTALSFEGGPSIWRVDASARDDRTEARRLWDDALIGGATWDMYGGASITSTADPALVQTDGG